MDKPEDTIIAGNTVQLTATVLPADASNPAVTWSSSNSAVARVSNQGLVTGVSSGAVSIKATTVDGGKIATCMVTVILSVSSVSLNRTSVTLGAGGTVSLSASILPAGAANKTVTWSSSDTGVAMVESDGSTAVVTALDTGTATITVTTEDGHKTATCTVTVALSARWASVPLLAVGASAFSGVAVDGEGSVYTVGYVTGTGVFSFGNSVQVTGANLGSNLILLKFASDGTAQWARTISAVSGASAYSGVAVDSTGNIIAVGTFSGADPFNFGNSVVATPPYRSGNNLVIVKYDSNGSALWARTARLAYGVSSYAGVAVDSEGNAYATGAINDGNSYDLGSSVVAKGAVAVGKNALLVKYNKDGRTLWAKSPLTAGGESFLGSVAITDGNVYSVGYLSGTSACGWNADVTVTGTAGMNGLLIKHSSEGVVQWARTQIAGSNRTSYNSVAVGASGSVYVGGTIEGVSANDFGGNVKLSGAYAISSSVLLLNYDADGYAQWGQSMASATGLSRFTALALDATEHLYAAGFLASDSSFDLGNQMTAVTPAGGNQVLLSKYSPVGLCERAQTATSVSGASGYSGIATEPNGGVFAAGYVQGSNAVDFGNSIKATGPYSGYNAVLVKYR